MATEYKTITDRLKTIINAERTDALSRDMTVAVQSVKIGQFVPTGTSAKAVLYIRPEVPGLVADMAGNIVRKERLMYLFSGAVSATTQEVAWADVQCFFNNLQNILMFYADDSGNWSGGHFGWVTGDDENPEQIGRFNPEPASDGCLIHFWLRWSCEFKIAREAL